MLRSSDASALGWAGWAGWAGCEGPVAGVRGQQGSQTGSRLCCKRSAGDRTSGCTGASAGREQSCDWGSVRVVVTIVIGMAAETCSGV